MACFCQSSPAGDCPSGQIECPSRCIGVGIATTAVMPLSAAVDTARERREIGKQGMEVLDRGWFAQRSVCVGD
jgi:hypothetical protein